MLIHDPAVRKLGKNAPKRDPRRLMMVKYLPVLPPIPSAVDWTGKVAQPIGMMLNDRQGCCTCSAVGHGIQIVTAANGAELTIPDPAVENIYVTVTGEEGAAFDPATGANDNGAAITDVLDIWRNAGVAGHKLGAYVDVEPSNLDHVKAAIALFGVVDIGLALPVSAQSQAVWDLTDPTMQGDAAPNSWGGHSVIIAAYDSAKKLITCATWGQWLQMTEAFFLAYCDEAHALLSDDWVSGAKSAPSGFDMAALQADLAALP